MIDNRQKAAMFIAVINRVSKQANWAAKLGLQQNLYDAFADPLNYRKLSRELIAYMKEDKDPHLYYQLVRFIETDDLRKLIETIPSSELRIEIEMICDAVDMLRTYGNECINSTKTRYPNLIPFFAYQEAEELFQRAEDAGFLDEEFQPMPGVDHYKLKLIAYGISEILKIPYRQRWCNFDRQWHIQNSSLCKFHLPMTKLSEFMDITQLFSEVDFRPMFYAGSEKKEPFATDMTKGQVIYMYDALRRCCYLSLKTKQADFLAMFGFGKVAKPYIRWESSMTSLVYFVRMALADTTRDIWRLTADWIKMADEKPLNRETCKSRSSFVCRNRSQFSFCDELDRIIAEARSVE